MSQIIKKFIGADQVGAGKIQLENDSFLRARNAADTADVNIVKVDADDTGVLDISLKPSANDSLALGTADKLFGGVSAIENSVNQISVYETTIGGDFVGQDAAALLSPDGLYDGNPAVVFEIEKAATATQIALRSADDADNDAAATKDVIVASGDKTIGTADSGQILLRSGNSTNDTGQIAILTGTATSVSGNIALSTGGAADEESRGFISLDAKRIQVDGGVIKFKVLAADPTDITYQQGDMYFNSASNRVRVYTGSVWQDLGDGAAANVPVWNKENLTLNATDISNGYKDLAFAIESESLDVVTEGVMQIEGLDYSVNLTGGTGGVTRVTWSGNWASIIADGDVVVFKYQYMAP